MLMQEFVARFSTQDEKSFLFEILHRVSRLDPRALMVSGDTAPQMWSEWSATDAPGAPAFGAARA